MQRILSLFRFTSLSMARGQLQKTILKEYKYEYAQYSQEPQLLQLLKSTGYSIIDEPKQKKIVLEKQFPSSFVQIEFYATPPPPEGKCMIPEENIDLNGFDPEQEDKIQKTIKRNEKEFEMQHLSVDYTVIVETSKGEAIAFECNTTNQITHINYIQPVYDIKEYKKRSKYQKFLLDHSGPEINRLDDQLQKCFYNYLLSYGINQQMNLLIESYAIDKEQRMYMEFLKSMDKFLDL